MLIFARIWREMEANREDFSKAEAAFERLLSKCLKESPVSIKDFASAANKVGCDCP